MSYDIVIIMRNNYEIMMTLKLWQCISIKK